MKQLFNFLGLATTMMSITLISCEKNQNNDSGKNKCNVSNPAEELSWLKEAIENVNQDEYAYYAMANYKGEPVFYYDNCNPSANNVSIIQNCSGENLGYKNALQDELTHITILWTHEDSKCNFPE